MADAYYPTIARVEVVIGALAFKHAVGVMKSVKKMLLGIAFLIVAVIGAVFFVNNSTIGAFIFFPALIIGIIICIDGYLSID